MSISRFIIKPLARAISKSILGEDSGFDPLSLFASGEEGAWYDPSDLTTLFQDSTGTIPVTTDGDPVGLMLDKSKGLVLGSELWTNTLTFIEDIDSAGSYDAGSETFTNTGTGTSTVRPRFNFSVGTEVGKRYEILFTISDATAGVIGRNIALYLANSTTFEHTTTVNVEGGTSQYRAILTCASAGVLRINLPGDAGDFSLKISIEQLKELPGNHATQASSGLKPIYRTDGTLHWLEFDGFDDAINLPVPVGDWNGTYVQGTMAGVIVGEISVPAGAYQIPTNPVYENDGTLTELIIRDDGGVIDPAELEQLIGYVGERGAVADFSGESDLSSYFRIRTDLTHLDLTGWDVSGVTSLALFAGSAPNLQSMDVSTWDTSSVQSLASFAIGCSSLAELDVSNWDTSSCTNLDRFVQQCALLAVLDVSGWNTSNVTVINSFVRGTSVSELDLRGWDTSSVTSALLFAGDATNLSTVLVYGGTGSPFADSPCTEYTNAFRNTNLTQQSYEDIVTAIESAGTSNGTLDITGGSATTTGAAQTAVDALRARGWTVTTPDGY